jgi:mevalonate kinase
VPHEGLAVDVETNLPVGRGMGSSAALAVAVVRARADLAGESIAADEVARQAMPIERAFHGTPSGVDVTVSAHGGCLWFKRGDPAVYRSLPCPALPIVVLDSGEDRETARMVQRVAERRADHEPALDAIGALVERASACLNDPRTLGPLLLENHALLRSIGVSTARLDAMVSLAMEHGARGAKLAGAGGGGVVMALIEDPEPLLAAARARSIPAFACRVWSSA